MSATYKALQQRFSVNKRDNVESNDETIDITPNRSKMDLVLDAEETQLFLEHVQGGGIAKKHKEKPPLVHHFNPQTAIQSGDVMLDSVGFPFHTLQIDNYSNVWLYVHGWYVQPWITGVQLPFPKGETSVRIAAQAPPGFTQPAATASTTVGVTAYEELYGFSSGTLIPAGSHP